MMGSGLARDEEQWVWFEEELDAAKGRLIALFLHFPLFITSPEEEDENFHCLRPEFRRRLLRLIRSHGGVKLVASGHTHEHKVIQ